MSIEGEGEESVELPVLGTLGEGVALLRPIAQVVATQLGIVLLAILVIDLVAGLAFGALWSGGPPSSSSGTADILLQLVGAVLGWALVANIVLGISRWALFGEPPKLQDLYRWNARQGRLLGVGMVGLLLIFVPGLAVVLVSDLAAGQPGVVILLSFLWTLYAVWFLSWFILATPVVASDEPMGVLEQAWRISRGHRLKLLRLAILILLPASVIMSLVNLVARSPAAGAWTLLLAVLAQFLIVYAVSILYAAVATMAWQKLTDTEADIGASDLTEPMARAPAASFTATSGFSQGVAPFGASPGSPAPAATSEETIPPQRSPV